MPLHNGSVYSSHCCTERGAHRGGGGAGGVRLEEDCRWIQPSEDTSAMEAAGAKLLRVHIDEIKNFRKEFWKRELPVVVTGVPPSTLLAAYSEPHTP